MRILILAALLSAACASAPLTAVVDGREVPRLTLEFNGQPYTIRHERAHPRPGGPSSGLNVAGGDIRGRVCGMNIDYDVSHRGDHVQLVGSIDGRISSELSVRDEGDARTFDGALGPMGVTLVLRPESLQGHVGRRVFALEPGEDDTMHGFMRSPNVLGASPIVIHGRSVLAAMPAADQAALLPNLLTCATSSSQYRVVTTLVLGFGGEVTDRPPQTSSVYTHSR